MEVPEARREGRRVPAGQPEDRREELPETRALVERVVVQELPETRASAEWVVAQELLVRPAPPEPRVGLAALHRARVVVSLLDSRADGQAST